MNAGGYVAARRRVVRRQWGCSEYPLGAENCVLEVLGFSDPVAAPQYSGVLK